MEKVKKVKTFRVNLALDSDFYQLIKKTAQADYVKVATWVKQYLKKSLLDKNNSSSIISGQNETKDI